MRRQLLARQLLRLQRAALQEPARREHRGSHRRPAEGLRLRLRSDAGLADRVVHRRHPVQGMGQRIDLPCAAGPAAQHRCRQGRGNADRARERPAVLGFAHRRQRVLRLRASGLQPGVLDLDADPHAGADRRSVGHLGTPHSSHESWLEWGVPYAGVAQLVAHRSCKAGVAGSSPAAGPTHRPSQPRRLVWVTHNAGALWGSSPAAGPTPLPPFAMHRCGQHAPVHRWQLTRMVTARRERGFFDPRRVRS
ncbi:protein of unknown function [Agreia sp. COWG]|nr:protein of unknown function [Agreia sp. COWG]